jgi:hypothetical protein
MIKETSFEVDDLLSCPNCGNRSSDAGITYCYLEWVINRVLGKHRGRIVIDRPAEYGQVGLDGEKATVTNTPNDRPDCSHYHCNACEWNWMNDTEQEF